MSSKVRLISFEQPKELRRSSFSKIVTGIVVLFPSFADSEISPWLHKYW